MDIFNSPLRGLGKYPIIQATSTSVNYCYQEYASRNNPRETRFCVLKSIVSITSVSGFRKEKKKTKKTKHKYGSAVRIKIIILRAVVQS